MCVPLPTRFFYFRGTDDFFKQQEMKVELEKLHIAVSPLTRSVFVGTIKRPGLWNNKIDMTNEFIGAVIERWKGVCENLSDPVNENISYDISVKVIDNSKNKK